MNQMLDTRGSRAHVRVAQLFTGADYWTLSAAFLSFLFSVALWFTGNEREGTFVGLWVPSILAFGIYLHLKLEASRHA